MDLWRTGEPALVHTSFCRPRLPIYCSWFGLLVSPVDRSGNLRESRYGQVGDLLDEVTQRTMNFPQVYGLIHSFFPSYPQVRAIGVRGR